MKKYQSAIALALLSASTILPANVAHASDMSTSYTPSISINRERLEDGKMVPAANVNFTITRVTIEKLDGFDLSKPETLKITSRLESREISTDETGKAHLDDKNFLKHGYFEIAEEGERPFVITLPFKDANGELSDDLVLTPKTGMIPLEPSVPTKPIDPIIKPGNNGNNTNTGNNNIGSNNNYNDNNTSNSIGNSTGGKKDEIMQTSGMTSDSVVKNVLLTISAMILGAIAFVTKKKKEEN